jgi:hypothetical protein
MKTIFTALLTACFLSLSAQTIYVDASNNTGVEDGTEQHPFNTLKEGIASSTAGTTIMIKAGTYYPDEIWTEYNNVLHLKPGVKLKGESQSNTMIEGIVVDTNQSNLAIGLEGLYFHEFRFSRGFTEGPFDASNIVSNCRANMLGAYCAGGIPPNDTTPGPIYGFLFENNDLGMEGEINFSMGSGDAQISAINNTCGWIKIQSGGGYHYLIDNNEVQFGIADKSGACYTTISNNIIINGGITDKSGAYGYPVEDQFIQYNTITCNENSPFLEEEFEISAMSLSCGSVTVKDNIINCTGNVSGIMASSGAPFHVINNTITVDEVLVPVEDEDEAIYAIRTMSGWGHITGNKLTGGQVGYYSSAGSDSFSGNEIKRAYYGFYSVGAEEVKYNLIEDCHSTGMILNGLRGPIHHNTIRNNAGHGIWVLRPQIDLGGGEDNCPGANVIQGNADYDLYIETQNTDTVYLSAKYNVWDHSDPKEIALYDIRDANDSTGLATIVDFMPIGYLAIQENSFGDRFMVYPNPTNGKFEARMPGIGIIGARFEIFDLHGRKLIKKQIPTGTESIEIDVSSLQSGIYFCRLISENTSATKKLIIQK